jgi:hypothetical protein
MMALARADSPTPVWVLVSCLVPALAPATTQATTKSSHMTMVKRGRRAAAREMR